MSLPAWFQPKGELVYRPVAGLENKKIRLHFLDRTLKVIAKLLHDFVLSEAYIQRPGMLQGLDPRFKLLGVLILIVSTTLVHSIPLLYGLYGLSFVLAILSRIEATFLLKRVWLVLPLFAGVIALPATLNLFTPGEPVLALFSLDRSYHWGPYSVPSDIFITHQGVSAALTLIGRVATSMSLALLLVLTTPWASLLKALRSLGVPQVFVQTLSMALRYLMLLCQVVQDMVTAKKSRTIRPGETKAEQRWVAGQAGTLFKWSVQMSLEVYQAMLARGYQGEVRILSVFQTRQRDYLWITFCAGLSVVLIYLGR